ncbi:pyridoxal phosphate-dependent aminotransferase [Moheibacter lacus]|uniref:Aminotransferase n=1 Tax=Moheibacter lacus TaxID=2745851 RepID=A0A838ZNP4_9FLAO|nr:pyridoxal phosphate-dependent aminotransferase [Moheibacter lacus]MBA5629346.1 pyridoxal phosphate-dependent aminotransferase [Moheibacter lacus]
MKLSTRIQNIEQPATIAMTQKARELRQQGKDVISLSIGEPDFDTPDFIKEAAIQAIHENYSHYTPVSGYPELKEAIVNKFKRDNNLDYKPSQIVVSTGAKQSIYNVFQSIINEGDEVIIPVPYWITYADIVKLSGGKPVLVETTIENDFKPTLESLENAISAKSKAMIFSSPCNPSGSVYSKSELHEIAKFAAKHDLIILSDEIYEHIVYEEKAISIASFPEAFDRTVTINGLSKAYAMTGWRIGFIGAPEWIAKACDNMQSQVTSGTNSIAQRAAIAALNSDLSEIQYMIDAFAKRREKVLEWINEIPGFKIKEPKGAFYMFPDVSDWFGKTIKGKTIQNSDDLANFLLEEVYVSTVAGSAFGLNNCLRFSYAASLDQLEEAMKRIKTVLS